MMTGIIPCLYNSFSFTQANLEGGNIICYDIKSRGLDNNSSATKINDIDHIYSDNNEDTGVSSRVVMTTPALPKRLPEPMYIKDPPELFESADGSDTDTDTSIETSTSTSTDISTKTNTNNAPSPDVNQIVSFNPNDIRKYSQNINETKCADSILWCLYIMMYGYEKFEMIDNYYTESNRFKFELIELLREEQTNFKS